MAPIVPETQKACTVVARLIVDLLIIDLIPKSAAHGMFYCGSFAGSIFNVFGLLYSWKKWWMEKI